MPKWGHVVQEAREAAGLSKVELADRIGVDPSMVSKMESGKLVGLSPDVFRRLTEALRTTLGPVELLNAMGYEFIVPPAGKLPRRLVQAALQLSRERQAQLEELALGLLLLEESEREKAR